MKSTVVFLTLLGITVAVASREKRQATGCLSAFQNVPNVCASSHNSQVFLKHPSDPTKFLQCDINSRMYIVQCPAGEEYNAGTTACQPASSVHVTLPLPQTNQPVTVQPPTIKQNTPSLVPQTPGLPVQKTPGLPVQKTPGLPVLTTPSLPVVTPSYNPCTPGNIGAGQLYFPFPGDKSKFYECDTKGNPKVLSCPPRLQWDQNILSCVYPLNSNQQTSGGSTGQVQPTPQIPSGHPSNPCTAQVIAAGRFFFPHPDPNKYIQCDMWGDAFTNSCPTKLVWNAYLETCFRPLFNGRK